MMGRRSLFADPKTRFKRSIFYDDEFCLKNQEIPTWLKNAAIHSVDFFVRLQNCRQNSTCINSEANTSKSFLDEIQDESEKFVIQHLYLGTAKIAGFPNIFGNKI